MGDKKIVEKETICTFCNTIIKDNITYTEDEEPSHNQCLESFLKHWEDRSENLDMLGY